MSERQPGALVEVSRLEKHFPLRKGLLRRSRGIVRAVDGVSFQVGAGETLGLVGESGCGKTTTGRALLRLLEPTSGRVLVDGRDILRLGGRELRALRRDLQVVFQDPYASLNPRMTVGAIVEEGLTIHRIGSRAERREKVARVLDRVGLGASCAARYPHEFSGGQRQRIGIARAIVLRPRFIVCDEAVSALDVSIQAQIVNLLAELQEELGVAYLFIAHDLALVEHLSDRVAVMYLGEIVESAPTRELFDRPLHPYTKALLDAIPVPDPERRRTRIVLAGDVPSAIDPPAGCRFHPRCAVAVRGLCDTRAPRTIAVGAHEVNCHVVEDELSRAGTTFAVREGDESRARDQR